MAIASWIGAIAAAMTIPLFPVLSVGLLKFRPLSLPTRFASRLPCAAPGPYIPSAPDEHHRPAQIGLPAAI
jgi:hypothetical protein